MRAIYQSPIGAIALKSTFNRFKFPFSQNSRFELKREIVAKGNLKAKTGKMPKREFNFSMPYFMGFRTALQRNLQKM